MKCEECLHGLEDYVEGELEAQGAAPLAAHLAGCQVCSTVYEQLILEKQLYARYSRGVEVSPHMWAAVVRSSIERPKVTALPPLLRLRDLISHSKFAFAKFGMISPKFAAAALALCALVLLGVGVLKGFYEPAREATLIESARTPNSGSAEDPEAVSSLIAQNSSEKQSENQSKFINPQPFAAARYQTIAGGHSADSFEPIVKEINGDESQPRLIAISISPIDIMPGASSPSDIGLVALKNRGETPVTFIAAPNTTQDYSAELPPPQRHAASAGQPHAATLNIINAGFAPKKKAADALLTRFEMGAHISSLSSGRSSLRGRGTSPGLGTRFTYNVNDHLAFEAEGNVFPGPTSVGARTEYAAAAQGLFGVKLGKRWKKLGLFAKLRPGFMTFRSRARVASERASKVQHDSDTTQAEYETTTLLRPAVDVGGVVEIYSSRRVVTRFDFSDAVVLNRVNGRPGAHPGLSKHNFQLSTGVSIRF